ncbi:MAG: sialate O-acetylesterase [Oscillospiraceae bacterium]|nr:sialate O-acetylesterase [Oscillospiraceae bacterium]
MNQIISFFLSVYLVLAAIPGAVMGTGENRAALRTQWQILSGGIWAHRDAEYDIIIVAGQSNAGGCGVGPVENEYIPTDLVQLMPQKPNFLGGFQIERAAENRRSSDRLPEGNIGLIFARAYIENGLLEPGRKILILKAAAGGTGFLKGDWGLNDFYYLNMLEMIKTALALNESNRVKAVLWHQGEGEALYRATEEQQIANLTALVNGVREQCGDLDLPFMAGNLVEEWWTSDPEACLPVIDGTRAVCANAGRAAFIESDGLTSNYQAVGEVNGGGPDIIHFSREALYIFGQRYFEAYQDIIAG